MHMIQSDQPIRFQAYALPENHTTRHNFDISYCRHKNVSHQTGKDQKGIQENLYNRILPVHSRRISRSSPWPEHTPDRIRKDVDRVERLTSGLDLHDRERLALRRPDGTFR